MPGRPDLAAMVIPLGRALVAAELPVLSRHGLSMWGYAVLLRLDERPLRGQSALAEAVGADKSRLIGVLDELQDQGLIHRRPDPTDRRAHLLTITAAGRRLRDDVQAAIQQQEEEQVLGRLPAADRQGFLNALRLLSGERLTDRDG